MAENTQLLPPEGNDKLGETVMRIWKEVVDDKERLNLHQTWKRSYEMKKGKHWKRPQSKNVPFAVANLIHVHRQRTINVLTDNNPIFNIARLGNVPEAENKVFDDLQRTAEHWWIDQEQQDVLESSIANGEDYGIAIEKMVWNDDIEEGGEAETIIVDPYHFGWYPVNLRDPRMLQQSDAVLHYYPMSLRDAKRKWPEFADKMKSEDDVFAELGDDRREINSMEGKQKGVNFLSTVSSVVRNIINFNSGATSDHDDQVLIIECWCHDTSTKKQTVQKPKLDEAGVPMIDPAGNLVMEDIEQDVPKYPGSIRRVTTMNSGKIVLEDTPNPNINTNLPLEQAKKTYLFDKYPFSAANSVKDTTNAWGMADTEQLEGLNKEFDIALSQLLLMKNRIARAKLINPKSSGVENREFSNVVGIVNPINPDQAAAIRYVDHPEIPADIQNSINLLKDLFFLVAGTFELDQAQVQGREVIAYKAIAALIERAATMMRGKIRNYSRLIRTRGRMYISMVQNFYTEKRWITYQDQNGQTMSKPVLGSDMIVPAKLTVVAGSTMPRAQVQVREEALTLFQQGAIDQQELLARLDWPNRNDVVERMKSGPFGELFQKLGAMGMPPELIQLMQMVSGLEMKNIQKAVASGELPPIQQVLAEIAGTAPPEDTTGRDGEVALNNAKVETEMATARKVVAEAEKIEAEKALRAEQVVTERVRQLVAIKGTEYDEEMIKLKRAEVVANIERDISSTEREVETAAAPESRREGIYEEQGAKSNNEDVLGDMSLGKTEE
ncbi:MAG: hypothetical protein WC455_25630 [Dehalococcoidia bacterium]|jgi:hypothetical protein